MFPGSFKTSRSTLSFQLDTRFSSFSSFHLFMGKKKKKKRKPAALSTAQAQERIRERWHYGDRVRGARGVGGEGQSCGLKCPAVKLITRLKKRSVLSGSLAQRPERPSTGPCAPGLDGNSESDPEGCAGAQAREGPRLPFISSWHMALHQFPACLAWTTSHSANGVLLAKHSGG